MENNTINYEKVINNYIDEADWRVKENSSVNYSLGGLILGNSGAMTANYWLNKVFDKDGAQAHKNGDIHIHDLSMLSPYCAGWSLKQLIEEGLGGVTGKIASAPAKHFSTLCNQMVNFLGVLQNEWAGAQAFSSVDTLCAPFIKKDGLTYDQVKQCVQNLVFGLNVSSRWGCVDTDTEVLSVDGFKKYNELKEGDLIYTWKSGKLELNPVIKVVIKEYDGEMHEYTGDNYSQLVTADHRVLFYKNGYFNIEHSNNIEDVEGIFLPVKYKNAKAFGEYIVNENNKEEINKIQKELLSKGICSYTKRYKNGHVLIIPFVNELVQIKERKTSYYKGLVWCPSVENGTAVFRRHGQLFISGQCQCPFTNFTLDWTVPADLAVMPAIVGGKEQDFTYADCKEEMDMFNKAFLEVMIEGDADGREFAYPIPTYSITKDFDWSETENNKLLFEMAAKYGTPYFSNYVNSDMNPSDVRSMAILGTQNVIYKDKFDRISKNEIRHLVKLWKKDPINNKYQILMNGQFVDITEMFEIDYSKYNYYYEVLLSNGQRQSFSDDHKCVVIRNGQKTNVRVQDIMPGDKFLLAKNGYDASDIGSYEAGYILGVYLAEGWLAHNNCQAEFAININRYDIVKRIEDFFRPLGARVFSEKQNAVHIYRVKVFSKAAVNFFIDFVSGNNAKDKRLKTKIYDTSLNFRNGFYDGYLDTDGSAKHNIFAHTTNKKLCQDLINVAATIGKYFSYRINNKNTRYFKPDKSDLVHFTSYELKPITPEEFNDRYYAIEIKEINKIDASRISHVYNFTVNTKEHLYELPNGIITHQCCRLRLELSELRRKNGGYFGSGDKTGSACVITLNMPRLAYKANNIIEFYNNLDRLMDIAAKTIEQRRAFCTKMMEDGLYPYTKRYLGNFDNHFSTIGLVGMNEACLNAKWIKNNLTDKKAQAFTKAVLNHMRDRLVIYQEEYGHLFNLEATPAESTAYWFAKKDKELYPDIITASEDTPYYTNSSHLPVNATDDIFDALDIQDELQTLYTSGTVFHAFLGEKLPDWKAAMELVKTIAHNYKLPYFTLSPTFSICKNHGYIQGEEYTCPQCHEKTEVYSRITGYYRPVQNWNNGKTQEFKDRKEYKIKITGDASLGIQTDTEDDCHCDINKNTDNLNVTDIENDDEDIFQNVHQEPEVVFEQIKSKTELTPGLYLVTTETCPKCKIAKKRLEENNIQYAVLNAEENEDLIKELNIQTAPTMIEVLKDKTIHTINSLSDIFEYVLTHSS